MGRARAQERRESRLREISQLRKVPYTDQERWWCSGTIAVVTGSNRGIGFEIARQLAIHGLTVVLTARDETKGQEAVQALQQGGRSVAFHKLDILDTASIKLFADYIYENYGGLDILINNAGVNFNIGSDNSVEFAETVIKTNYFGTKWMVEAMIPLMKPSAFGARILNVSSRLGRLNGRRNFLKVIARMFMLDWKMVPSIDPNDEKASLQLIEDLTENADQVQKQVLNEILTRNSETEYLNRFLTGLSDKDLFKKKVPIVHYEDIELYIEKIANGEPSEIISSQPISELLTSSGTSGGQPKIMPSTAEDLDRKSFVYNLLIPVMNKYVTGLDQGKGMHLLFIKPEIRTPSGLMARPVLTSYYKSSNFRNRPFNKFNVYTSPDETILCSDSKQSMFCQLLCGLIQRDEVLRVGAVFASAFLRAIKFLEDNWQELCLNIRTGHISDWITDLDCRKSVMKILDGPKSQISDLIEFECSKRSWEGIIKRLWPRTKFIDVIVTGSMAQYIPTLDFYSGGLPLLSTMYASSECYFGINLKPLSKPSEVSYTLLPNMAYFEFLPVEKNHEDLSCNGITNHNCLKPEQQEAAAVDLVDVKIGHYYELVVTTFTGLYRYRVGDILMVTGFHNKAPQFRFVHRRNVVLSIDTDKTNEEDLLQAVTRAKNLLEPLDCLLTEYTSYADTSSIPGHYVLFWELKTQGNMPLTELDSLLMEDCCYVIEESLDSVYRRCRSKDKSIGPLEIRVVKHGTFDALMDFCVAQGSSVNQYKTPRCIKSKEALEILDSRVVQNFFSRKLPLWSPYIMGSR